MPRRHAPRGGDQGATIVSFEVSPIFTSFKYEAYIRASTDKQDLNHQKLEILEFARKKSMDIDEFMETTISSRKTTKQRRVDELFQKLTPQDTLIVTELSFLGRSTAEVISLVNA